MCLTLFVIKQDYTKYTGQTSMKPAGGSGIDESIPVSGIDSYLMIEKHGRDNIDFKEMILNTDSLSGWRTGFTF